ncbi:MAG TPA: NYN domain-containing protein [Candidatus Paceibacterota bacterium]|nr:NYN domain-containing protein [Candidatus Paceibacterota bacterium]HPR91158.1 NYN domain-containing protein [Candidatus Paceibacterota bacterium]
MIRNMAGKSNYAYIDGNNLYRGVKNSSWNIDLFRFKRWLADKYGVTQAYYFIGLIPKEKDLYETLQKAGFTLIFKGVVYDGDGKPKGNCDADLVLQAVRDVYENACEQSVLVSSDGDYAGLVKFLKEKNKLKIILSPSVPEKCSILLKRTNAPITYLNDVKRLISMNANSETGNNEKAPIKDEP